jgi:hypothetical protein
MSNLNLIIVGRGGEVCRVSNNPVKGTTKLLNYDPCVPANVTGANRINCLSIVVATLQQLKEAKMDEGKDIATIYTVGLVSDMIHNGTFKYWLNGGAKKLDGSDVDEHEIALWTEFVGLYKELFMNVNFKNVSSLNPPKNLRVRLTQDQIALNKLASMAWERVAPAEPVVEEAEGL